MSTKIESLKYDVLRFAPDNRKGQALKKKLEKIFSELVGVNQDNFEAILPIRHVDMNAREIHWYDLEFETDWETSSEFTYVDPITDDEECISGSERDARIEKVEEKIEELTADNPGGKNEERISQLDELREALQGAEQEYSELLWNTSWRPYDEDVNKELAESIPQITWAQLKETDKQTEESFITLTSCGQDNGPALMAYVILEHGVVPEGYVKYWTNERSWTLNVIGRSCFYRCAEKLGVLPQLKKALRRDAMLEKRRRAKQEAEWARKKVIRDRKLSPELEKFFRDEITKAGDGYTPARATYEAMVEVCGGMQDKKFVEHPMCKEWTEVIHAWEWHERLKTIIDHHYPPPKVANDS